MSNIHHPLGCTCGHACRQAGAHDEKETGVSRRQALRSLGAMGVAQRRNELVGSRAVQSGRVGKFTLLFTSDIHSQLHTHDEFFLENGKPVYKKRGGYGVLKTMVDTLRNEDPANKLPVAGFVKAGIIHIVERQEDGWSYIKAGF